MIALSQVIERFAAEYQAQYNPLPSQLHALDALRRCRTRLAATFTARCSDPACAAQRVVPHSCGHRHCPHCQHGDSQRWIERRQQQLIPGAHFLVTFTLPAELRSLAYAHQRIVYAALMDCAWRTLEQFALNRRGLRGRPGAVAVLHTHSRALDFHPHVHLVMPAAALDLKSRLLRRLDPQRAYLFNHTALARVFRGKLIAALKAHGLPVPVTLPEAWVVHCKHLAHGAGAFAYLGRYLYRGVIREADILRCDAQGVTYRWRDGKTGHYRQRTVDGAAFVHRVLQHVLPKGLRRSRCYGILGRCSRAITSLMRLLVFKTPPAPPTTPRSAAMRCPCCGAPMRIILRRGRPFGDLGDQTSSANPAPAATPPPLHTMKLAGAQA